jgi:hypothetical protein
MMTMTMTMMSLIKQSVSAGVAVTMLTASDRQSCIFARLMRDRRIIQPGLFN